VLAAFPGTPEAQARTGAGIDFPSPAHVESLLPGVMLPGRIASASNPGGAHEYPLSSVCANGTFFQPSY
jgi:hypothetical protein